MPLLLVLLLSLARAEPTPLEARIPTLRAELAAVEEELGEHHPELADKLDELGNLYLIAARYDEARTVLERSIALREVLTPDKVGGSQLLLGRVLASLGDAEGALALAGQALEDAERRHGPVHLQVARALDLQGGVWMQAGKLVEANGAYARSLAIREEVLGADDPLLAVSLSNLGAVLAQGGHYAQAEPLLERALALDRAHLPPNHPDLATSIETLATARWGLADAASATALSSEALAIREAALGPDHPMVAWSLTNIGIHMRDHGDNEGAKPLLERALAIREGVFGPDHPLVGVSLSVLGNVTENLGDVDGALAHYARAMQVLEASLGPMHPLVAVVCNDTGSVLRRRGDHAAAAPLLERSLAIREAAYGPVHPEVSKALNNLANLYWEQGELDKAKALLTRASDGVAQTLGPDHPQRAIPLRNLAGIATHQHDSKGARAYSEQALAIHEAGLTQLPDFSDRQALAYLASVRLTYETWLWTHATPAEDAAAWATTLRWKGVVTRTTRDQNTEVTVAAVCAALPRRTALVDFVRYHHDHEPTLVAFVVDGHCEPVRISLGPAAPIEEAVSAWRDVLAPAGGLPPDPGLVRQRGLQVTRAIWTPLSERLEGVRRVVMVPDGELAAVPFGALPLPGGELFIEQHAVQTLPDAADAVRTPQSTAQGMVAVAMGDFSGWGAQGTRSAPARCAGEQWRPLPGTYAEVDAVVRKVQHRTAEPITVLRDSDATEPAVTKALQGARVVHLATHGYVSEDCESAVDIAGGLAPLALSGLALSPGSDPGLEVSDGVLTAADVARLDLDGTELVVLSACETGLGQRTVGEGVQGLQRGFAIAGAAGLVMSLWAVDDAATAALMERFYEELLRGRGRHPAEALRLAQLSLLGRARPDGATRPETWAAFTYSGQLPTK